MKRLRKKFDGSSYWINKHDEKIPIPKTKIRYFHCGEYGDTTFRPHYHALLFNCDFPDKVPLQTTSQDHTLYESEILNDLWSHPETNCYMGNCNIGNVTFQSAAYCARYITKKITGPKSYEYYDGLTPEYATMSRMPGLASSWLEKFYTDIYPSDSLVVNGSESQSIPFYDIQYTKILNSLPPPSISELSSRIDLLQNSLQNIKNSRTAKAKLSLDDNTDWRLKTREQVKLAQITTLTRNL